MFDINQYHRLDLAIAGILLIGIGFGAKHGFIRQTLRLAATLLAFTVAYVLHDRVDALVRTTLAADLAARVTRLHTYLVTFLGAYLIYFFAAALFQKAIRACAAERKPGDSAVDVLGLGWFDRILGAAIGAVATCLLVGAGLIALGSSNEREVQAMMAGSKLQPYAVEAMQTILEAVPSSSREEFEIALKRLENAGRAFAGDIVKQGAQDASNRMNGFANGVETGRQALQKGSALVKKMNSK